MEWTMPVNDIFDEEVTKINVTMLPKNFSGDVRTTRLIRARKQVVNISSFIVRLNSGKHIDFSLKSPFGGGRPGRVKRKNIRKGQGGGVAADEEED